MKNIRRLLVGTTILALFGCVGPVTLAPLPYAHPASPATPAGALPPLGTALDDVAPAGGNMQHGKMAPEGMTHDMPMSGATSSKPGKFQCPMHADVHSDKPGRCPICGMKLMEKKSESHGAHE